MVEDSPYEPPASDVTERPCPTCGATMQAGKLYSIGSIGWVGEGATGLKKFLGGDRPNPARPGRVPGHRCDVCQQILIKERGR